MLFFIIIRKLLFIQLTFVGGVFIPEEYISFKEGFSNILKNYSDTRKYKIRLNQHIISEDSHMESRYNELIRYKQGIENNLKDLVNVKGFRIDDSRFGSRARVVFDIQAINDSLKSNTDFYVVYLFKPNRQGVFLNLMLVVNNFMEGQSFKPEEYKKISNVRDRFREYIKNNLNNEKIDLNKFSENLDLEDLNQFAIAYGEGSLFNIYYEFKDGEFNTDEAQFINDLNQFLDLSIEVDKFHQKFLEIKDSINSRDDKGESIDINDLTLENNINEDAIKCTYWLYSPGKQASEWDEHYCKNIMAMDKAIEDLRNFNSEDEICKETKKIFPDGKEHPRVASALWDFANVVKPGDIVFAKNGVNKIIGQGIVESDYFYEPNEEYGHIRKVKWIEEGTWDYGDKKTTLPQDSLTNITENDPQRLDIIKGFFKINPCDERFKYTKRDFINEAFIEGDDYDAMEYLLRKYKNLILQGPPGVGKTFLAKRLADSIIGYRYSNRVEMVQFHQSYSYEDFIMGYKPAEKGFTLVNGPFYDFCKKAEKCPSKDYFFIIDEINRGDLSKIFGELFMLIEDDKRGEKYQIKLLYTDEPFSVPENIYIIGLMNTADRSIAMVDYALRRRFAFFDLNPGFKSENFKQYQEKIQNSYFDKVIEQIKELNKSIGKDDSLGEGFCIGHSYFCNLQKSEDIKKDLRFIIDYKILPLLKEYWFDNPENDEIQKLEDLSDRLKTTNKVINEGNHVQKR